MIFRLLITGVLLFSFSCFSYTDCTAPELPNNISITEGLFSLPVTFNVGENYGVVRKNLISPTPHYYWYDSRGREVATAKKAFFSLGTKIDVFDCKGRMIGAIKKKLFGSLLSVSSEYSILDKEGRELAKSRKVEFGATSITLSKDGQAIAKLERPWLRIRDIWSINIFDHNTIDSRLLVMIGVFKTDASRN